VSGTSTQGFCLVRGVGRPRFAESSDRCCLALPNRSAPSTRLAADSNERGWLSDVARTSQPVARRVSALLVLAGVVASLGSATALGATALGATVTATTRPSSSTTTSSTTTTTTLPDTARAPSASGTAGQPEGAGLDAAEALLLVTQQATVNLDQLEAIAERAQVEAFGATVELSQQRSVLAMTSARVAKLKGVASAMSIDLYMASAPGAKVAQSFATSQAGEMRALTEGVYDQVAASRVTQEIARLEDLQRLRERSAAQAASSARQAKQASARAAQALTSAKKTQAHLVALLASVSPATLAALAELQANGDASIEALLHSGKLHLAKGVADPPAVLGSAFVALEFAAAQIGKPYVWGGAGPQGFDCSGLVQQAWAAAGVALPRVAADQSTATVPISFSQLQPGDLVFFEQPVGHVGIYIGGGQMIDAPYTGAFVRIDSIFWSKLEGFGRVTATS
jgi:peptidoglycan DL-endopeptidase CwlO